jgi:predicted transcriptional regulator
LRHRPRFEISMEIIGRLVAQPCGPTRLSRICNLGYDKCVEMLTELERKGFVKKEIVDSHEIYSATPDGFQVAEDFARLWRKVYPETNLR